MHHSNESNQSTKLSTALCVIAGCFLECSSLSTLIILYHRFWTSYHLTSWGMVLEKVGAWTFFWWIMNLFSNQHSRYTSSTLSAIACWFPQSSCTYLLLLLGLSHGTVMFLLVEDLLHLAVLQVVQLPHSILRPLDQVHEDPRRPITKHKIMLKKRREPRPRVHQLAKKFCTN